MSGQSREVRALRRWLSMTEAVQRIPGAKKAVATWLRARGLVRRLPWGTEAVDIEAVYHRLTLESVPTDPLPEGAVDFVGVVEQAPAVQLESPRRSRRSAKTTRRDFRFVEP